MFSVEEHKCAKQHVRWVGAKLLALPQVLLLHPRDYVLCKINKHFHSNAIVRLWMVCVWWCLRLTVSHPWHRRISPQQFLLVMMPMWLPLSSLVWTEWLQDWSGSITVYSKSEGVWTLKHLQCTQYSVQSKGCLLIFSYKLFLVERWCSWCEKVQYVWMLQNKCNEI